MSVVTNTNLLVTGIVSKNYALAAERDDLIAEVEALKDVMPANPLDSIIDQLGGPEEVAEMTGRINRVVRDAYTGVFRHDTRHKGQFASANIEERRKFQSGEKLVAIISEASSTGVSLHADVNVGNQKRRVHITVELPWSAEKAVQQFGRSHRSNQSSAPRFIVLTTDISAECRFASAVGARLMSLGALTKGDRRAAATKNGDSESLEGSAVSGAHGAKALALMQGVLHGMQTQVKLPGFVCKPQSFGAEQGNDFTPEEAYAWSEKIIIELKAVSILETTTKVVTFAKLSAVKSEKTLKFMNRLFLIKLDAQMDIFQLFTQCLTAVKQEDVAGANGIVDVAGDNFKIKETTLLYKDVVTDAEANLIEYTCNRGVSWETALKIRDQAILDGRKFKFLKMKSIAWGFKHSTGKRYYALAEAKKQDALFGQTTFYRLTKPTQGRDGTDLTWYELKLKWSVVSDLIEVARCWTEEYDVSEHECGHAPNAKCKSDYHNLCMYRRRIVQRAMLVGSLLPRWTYWQQTLGWSAKEDQKDRFKIVRLTTDSLKTLVGVSVDPVDVGILLDAMRESGMPARVRQQESARKKKG